MQRNAAFSRKIEPSIASAMNGMTPSHRELDETRFLLSGAIAFFSLMLAFFVVVWLVIYALMITRA